MPIVAKAGPSFTPAPEGVHAAVCVDVVDLGIVKVTYKDKTTEQHKIRIVWQIDEDQKDGKPFECSQRYTLSLHEKAGLRKMLESWRGRQFTEEELQGFDVETILGKPCMLNIIHNNKQGTTYANVVGVMRLGKGMTVLTPRDYVRHCDRKPEDQGHGAPDNAWGITDDDVPF